MQDHDYGQAQSQKIYRKMEFFLRGKVVNNLAKVNGVHTRIASEKRSGNAD